MADVVGSALGRAYCRISCRPSVENIVSRSCGCQLVASSMHGCHCSSIRAVDYCCVRFIRVLCPKRHENGCRNLRAWRSVALHRLDLGPPPVVENRKPACEASLRSCLGGLQRPRDLLRAFLWLPRLTWQTKSTRSHPRPLEHCALCIVHFLRNPPSFPWADWDGRLPLLSPCAPP